MTRVHLVFIRLPRMANKDQVTPLCPTLCPLDDIIRQGRQDRQRNRFMTTPAWILSHFISTEEETQKTKTEDPGVDLTNLSLILNASNQSHCHKATTVSKEEEDASDGPT